MNSEPTRIRTVEYDLVSTTTLRSWSIQRACDSYMVIIMYRVSIQRIWKTNLKQSLKGFVVKSNLSNCLTPKHVSIL
jgi:hypothetical protein